MTSSSMLCMLCISHSIRSTHVARYMYIFNEVIILCTDVYYVCIYQ